MYGIVNDAIHKLVVEKFGEAAWSNIKKNAGVTVDSFVTTEFYPDSITYSLVGAASEVRYLRN